MFLDKEEKDIFGALLQVNSQEAQAMRSGEEEGKDQRGKSPSQSAASLPAMYQISQEWKKNKDSGGKVKSPLRIVLLKCYLREMTARLEKATKDPDTRAAVLKAAWAVESSGELLWNFQQYDKEKQEELVDPSLKPIPHAKILKICKR